jgi:hypothetical protein
MMVPKEVKGARDTHKRGRQLLARLGHQDFAVDIINGQVLHGRSKKKIRDERPILVDDLVRDCETR